MKLPDMDDDDLDEQMQSILAADAIIYRQIEKLFEDMEWKEKMFVGLRAYHSISPDLCTIKPQANLSEAANEALLLIRKLGPQGRAELASQILMDDWDL